MLNMISDQFPKPRMGGLNMDTYYLDCSLVNLLQFLIFFNCITSFVDM